MVPPARLWKWWESDGWRRIGDLGAGSQRGGGRSGLTGEPASGGKSLPSGRSRPNMIPGTKADAWKPSLGSKSGEPIAMALEEKVVEQDGGSLQTSVEGSTGGGGVQKGVWAIVDRLLVHF